jgi:hypothetical protein
MTEQLVYEKNSECAKSQSLPQLQLSSMHTLSPLQQPTCPPSSFVPKAHQPNLNRVEQEIVPKSIPVALVTG